MGDGYEALSANLGVGVVVPKPLGYPTGSSADEAQRGLTVGHVLLGCGRCRATLEVVERQVEQNLVVVGGHEVLQAEEVRVGVEDIGEGALWLSCVVAPDALKG